jgi:bifunctional non-homologous end joining protein LigD
VSRNQKELTRRYPTIVEAAQHLNARQAVFDGEIVALDEKGLPSFQALQHPSSRPQITFYAFDLLHLNGNDLTGSTLEQRRAMLPGVVGDSGILISEELPGTAAQVIDAVRALGLEGVIAKRRDSKDNGGSPAACGVLGSA